MAIGDVIARLSVSLGLETAAFDKGAKQAAGSVGKLKDGITRFGSAVAGAFVGSGIIAGIQEFTAASRQAVDAVGGLGEAAAALGVTTDALQEFRYAATQVGLSTEQMDGILGQFSKRLGEGLLTGKGKFVSALQEVGLSLDQLQGKTTTQQIGLIADAINKVGTEAEKSALLTQFFGKQGQAAATLLADGSAGINQYAEDARKLGIVVSEATIKQADAAADQISALERVAEAQRNAVLTTPENIKATLEYAKGMAELKSAATGAFAALVRGASDNDKAFASLRASAARDLNAIADGIGNALNRAKAFVVGFAELGKNLVLGLVRGIKNAGVAVYSATSEIVSGAIARAKAALGIQSPSRVFMEIGDYIGQGLAIGIEGGTGKVAAATQKLTAAARQAAEETQALFARLFPELSAANKYRDEMALIDAAKNKDGKTPLSDDAKTDARIMLGREFTGTGGEIPLSFMESADAMREALEKVTPNIGLFADKAKGVTVQVAKSFKDMADATIQSLSNLTGAIRGGGFLDILSGVIGLGLQLGSFGAFGSKIAGRLNAKVPGYANGTNFAPGGLSIVGERGPELVNLRRGSQVISNTDLRGMGRGGGIAHIVPSPYFDVVVDGRVQRAAPGTAAMGAQMAGMQAARAQSRQWR